MDHGRRPHSHHCRCHVVATGSTEFQKILESEDAGIVIYRYVARAGGAMQNRGRLDGEALIIQNTKKTLATSDNLTAAFEQNKLTCPRCIKIVEYAQSMVRHIPLIEGGDIVSTCDNCRRQERPRTSCRCTEIFNKFLSSRDSEERETRRQRIKVWLKRVQHLLQRAGTCQIEENKPRARSELSFDDVFSDFIKSERKELAEKQPRRGLGGSLESLQTQTEHVRFNLVEPESAHPKTPKKKISSPFLEDTSLIDLQETTKHFPSFETQAAEKSVHLPKRIKPESLMDIFFKETISQPSLLQQITEKIETKPKRSSILKSKQHIRSHLQREDSVVPERERRRSLSPPPLPWKHYSQEHIFKTASEQDLARSPKDFTFLFPKEIKKEVQLYTSSSDLIKTTQDKLNEKEKRKKDELKSKSEEKEQIKRANKEQEKIKKIESARKIVFEVEKQRIADSKKQSLEDFEKQRLRDEKHRTHDEKANITKETKDISRSSSPASSKKKSEKVEPTKIEKQRLQDEKMSIPKEKKDMSRSASPASSKQKSEKVEPSKIQETKGLGKTEDDKNALKVIKKPEKLGTDKERIPKKMEIDKEAMPKKIDKEPIPKKKEIDKEAMPKKTEKQEKMERREKQDKSSKNKEDIVQKQKESKPQFAEKPQPPRREHDDKSQVPGKKIEKENKKKYTAADDSFKSLQAQKEKERLEHEKLEKTQQKETESATKKAIEAEKATKDTRVKDKVQKQKESKPQFAKEEKLQPQRREHDDKTQVDATKIEKEGKKNYTAADDSFRLLQAQKEKERLEQEHLEKTQQKETESATKKALEAEKAAKDTRVKPVPSMKLTLQLKEITEKPTPEVSEGKKTVKEEKPKLKPAGDPLKVLEAQKERERLENVKREKNDREQQKETEQALKKAAEAEKLAKDKITTGEAAAKLHEMKTEKPAPEKPKSPPRKRELPTTKELSLREVKPKKTSQDDLILKLVQLKQSEKKDREITKEKNKAPGIRSSAINFKKAKHNPFCGDSGSEIFDEIVENKPGDKLHEIIIGTKLYLKHEPLNIELQECVPIPIVEMKELEQINDTKTVEIPAQTKSPPKVSGPTKTAKTKIEVTEVDIGKGIIRYALSDRTFIDKGWTMLPTEKVVRKMNVYRMRPAHPEFDWFEHNKNKRLMQYDSGEKLAEFDDDGRGRLYYKSGMLAFDYYNAEELNAQQRFVVYSSGEPDERGRTRPRTILATFDYLGNGVVFDHTGKIRLKYNQTEGVVLDRSIGPVSHWKWHTLNDPPVLQQVMIDTQMPYKDANIEKLGPASDKARPDNEEMLAIEFDNFIKEKSRKLTQKFKPFQIRMKALKINEYFSLRVLDQATVYLLFRDGTTNLKLNIGMVLDHKEIVDTDTAEVGEVSNSLDRLPARTDSLAELQRAVAQAQRTERLRVRHERRLKPAAPCGSADQLRAGASRPIRHTLLTDSSTGTGVPTQRHTLVTDSSTGTSGPTQRHTPITDSSTGTRVPTQTHCRKPSSSNLYYDTRI